MEPHHEEGEGEGGAARGDVGRAGDLRLVTQVVGTVTVGLRLQQRNPSQHVDNLQKQLWRNLLQGKTRPEILVDAITNPMPVEVNANNPCEIPSCV